MPPVLAALDELQWPPFPTPPTLPSRRILSPPPFLPLHIMHGTQCWLTGFPIGAGPYCCPEKVLGNLPLAYVCAAIKIAESATPVRCVYEDVASSMRD